MSWASGYIQRLQAGETVEFRPRGKSMEPKINSGALVRVEPVTAETPLAADDIVLCRVRGNIYLHWISAVDGPRYQISNNRKHVNGWINRRGIYGRLLAIEP